MLNPFKSRNKIQMVSLARVQGEANTQLLAEFIKSTLVTKQDLSAMGLMLRQEVNSKIDNQIIFLRADFRQLESRLIIKIAIVVLVVHVLVLAISKIVF